MSRADRKRLLTITAWVGTGAAFVVLVWVGLMLRAWECERVAERVAELLREPPRSAR